jgi:hypothetical protein
VNAIPLRSVRYLAEDANDVAKTWRVDTEEYDRAALPLDGKRDVIIATRHE